MFGCDAIMLLSDCGCLTLTTRTTGGDTAGTTGGGGFVGGVLMCQRL